MRNCKNCDFSQKFYDCKEKEYRLLCYPKWITVDEFHYCEDFSETFEGWFQKFKTHKEDL